jgi:hypothetical protein
MKCSTCKTAEPTHEVILLYYHVRSGEYAWDIGLSPDFLCDACYEAWRQIRTKACDFCGKVTFTYQYAEHLPHSVEPRCNVRWHVCETCFDRYITNRFPMEPSHVLWRVAETIKVI